MKRREFITLLGGAAARGRSRRGRSSPSACGASACSCRAAADDPEFRPASAAFLQGLQQLGWTDRPQRADRHPLGRRRCRPTSQIRGRTGRARAGCHPGQAAATVAALLQATRTVPIVFAIVPDPVGAGFVESLARPGGNATGFMPFEYS